MRVCIPLIDVPYSGGVRVLVEMANGLSRRGHDCFFVSPKGTRALPYPTIADTIEVGSRLPYMPNVRNIVNALLLGKLIPECDIVVANTWLSAFPVIDSLKHTKAVGFYFIQGDERLFYSNHILGKIKSYMASRSYTLPLKWLTNSTWLRDRLQPEFHREAAIANPGVNISIFKPIYSGKSISPTRMEPLIIVSVGRSVPLLKGLADLLEATAIISHQANIRLILISQEDLRLHTPHPVEVYKPLTDQEIAEAYCKADIFVFPSWYEGYGLPPLEAMACGVPVITTDCGGVRDFAIHEHNCLIIPPRDPQAMADAIIRLIRQPYFAKCLAHEGTITATRFSWEHFVTSVESIFLSSLEQQSS